MLNVIYLAKKVYLIMILMCIFQFQSIANTNVETEFENNITLWYKILNEKPNYSSNPLDYTKNEPFQNIIDLGPKVVPFIIEKIGSMPKSIRTSSLSYAIKEITKTQFTNDEYEEFSIYSDKYLTWWVNDRLNAQQRFEELYDQWMQLPEEDKMKRPVTYDWSERFNLNVADREQLIKNMVRYREARKQWEAMPEGPEKERMRPGNTTVYQRILNIGIPALPYAVEKVAQGETNLIEAINYWTDNALAAAVDEADVKSENMSAFVHQWWEENKEKWTLPEIEEQN